MELSGGFESNFVSAENQTHVPVNEQGGLFKLLSHICHLGIWYLITVCRFDPFLIDCLKISTKPVPQRPKCDTTKGLTTGLDPAGILEKLYSWRNSNLFQIRHVPGNDSREPTVALFLISPDASMYQYSTIFSLWSLESILLASHGMHNFPASWNVRLSFIPICHEDTLHDPLFFQ